MLKTLLKKQMFEVWRGYFINAKTNKARSTLNTVMMFLLFAALMIGCLGVMFGYLSYSLCAPLAALDMGWLYYIIFGLLGVVLGIFGSVFNTYSGLYLGKDNELLLSMPIPIKDIVFSRLINVYLLGLMYEALVVVPALIVYWIFGECTPASVLGGLAMLLIVSLLVFFLTCLLGWCVARISTKVKNKSFVTVALSVLFIGAYYFFYFKAQTLMQDLILNATLYGEKIKGSAYALYLFGRIGVGDGKAVALFGIAAVALTLLTVLVLLKTFVKIATSTGTVVRRVYKEKTAKARSPFLAMVCKEFGRFGASPNYMLNCGLGVLFVPAIGIAILIKGSFFSEMLTEAFGLSGSSLAVIVAAAIMLVSSMNDMAAPSVSLEGKNLWIAQSIPVNTRTVLCAKLSLQLVMTTPLVLFSVLCGLTILSVSPLEAVLYLLAPVLYSFFSAALSLASNLKFPNVHWTSELIPVKQSAAVTVALFAGLIFAMAFGGLYLWQGIKIGAAAYLAIADASLALLGLLLFLWIEKRGTKIFANL